MVFSQAEPRILGLSFHKEITEIAFYDFEKLLIYGIHQTLKMFTEVVFLDYAVPANRLMLKQQLSPEMKAAELRQLGKRFHCNFVFHGTLEPEIGPTGYMDGIQINFQLFDISRSTSVLNLSYYFTQFDGNRAKIAMFAPTWEGLQDLRKWIIAQLIGAVLPEKSNALWNQIQRASIAYNLPQFQKLASAHYLGGEEGFSQKYSLLNNLTHDDPNLFLAHLELGHLQKRVKNYPQAISSLETAFKIMKEATPRQLALCATEIGVCYALSQDINKACDWWRSAIEADATLLNSYMNLAHALEEQGKVGEAEQYFKKAADIAPEDSRVYDNLARLYSKLELWEKAIIQYERQLLLEPDNAWAYSNMANCYLQRGSITEAKTYLLKTTQLDPDGEAGRCAHFILSGLQAAEV